MRKLLWGVAAALMSLAAMPGAQAATITLQSTAPAVEVGSSVFVDIAIGGINTGATPSLSGFQMSVLFNNLVYSFVDVTYGDPTLGDQLDLDGFGPFFITSSTANQVDLFELSFDTITSLINLQPGAFVLARLEFSGLIPGTGSFSVTNVLLSDQIGNAITVSPAATPISVDVVPVGTLLSVPEPSTIFTGLAGLGMIAALRARRKRQ